MKIRNSYIPSHSVSCHAVLTNYWQNHRPLLLLYVTAIVQELVVWKMLQNSSRNLVKVKKSMEDNDRTLERDRRVSLTCRVLMYKDQVCRDVSFHRRNMELDLQSLFGLHVHSCICLFIPTYKYIVNISLFNAQHYIFLSWNKYEICIVSVEGNKWFWFLSCAHLLRTRNTPFSPHLGSHTKTLLVRQDRRHLFVTLWLTVSFW